jgi:antitoxin MazE
VILDIKQWGNNLGVRLPTANAREAHVYTDQRVKLTVSSGHPLPASVNSLNNTLPLNSINN